MCVYSARNEYDEANLLRKRRGECSRKSENQRFIADLNDDENLPDNYSTPVTVPHH